MNNVVSHEWFEVFRRAKELGIAVRMGKSVIVDIIEEDGNITGIYVENLRREGNTQTHTD